MSGVVEIVTQQVLTAIVIVGIWAAVAEGIVEYLIAPLWERYKLDPFWLRYWAWGWAGALVIVSGPHANAFVTIIPNAWIGLALTAIVAARGANFLHDVYSGAEKRNAAEKLRLNEGEYWLQARTEARGECTACDGSCKDIPFDTDPGA